ncbi:MAG TPA: prolyl oligopeptidase family serine peptidase [Bacteroidales bacterium]|nr:prolyl oligopeptidase family serine peptidase [Bacteroidales bacterium]
MANNKCDTIINLPNQHSTLPVYLKFPGNKTAKGVIVVLPGWKLPVLDWYTKTTFCQKALAMGYILIMPEMSKSIYATQRYPETRKDWLQFATRTWFKDTLITYLQKQYGLLLPGQKNYLLGLSTGARGVALLALDCPEIFRKGAGLSGDYDQTQMPKDALMTGWYGSFSEYTDRWKGPDNVVSRFKELKIPLYLGHGKADKIVPVSQTIQFADSLKKYNTKLVTCHINETAEHNYDYWNSEVDAVLAFFNKHP